MAQATDLLHQLQGLVGQGTGAGALDPSNPAVRAIQAQIGVQAGAAAIQNIFWMIFFGTFILLAMSLLLPGRKRPMAAAEASEATDAEPAAPAAV